jgi:hypothetical protein
VTASHLVVCVTREHPVTGADQLLVDEPAASVPQGAPSVGETMQDAA